ncbi:hypothetical protein AKO1_003639 [Acrasis kona]|uniref:Uncharacterized protein n=1 Tax=Acrasis kona TaxID=1008807 RepID=A0AAW2Z7H1_9EUKA
MASEATHKRPNSERINRRCNTQSIIDLIPRPRSLSSVPEAIATTKPFLKHGGVSLTLIQSENLHTKGLLTPKYYVEVSFEDKYQVKYLERTPKLRGHNAVIDKAYFFPIENSHNEYINIKVVHRGELLGSLKRKVSDIPINEPKVERMILPNKASGNILISLTRQKFSSPHLLSV